MSADLCAEAPGEAWQSCASAVPGPPGTTSSVIPTRHPSSLSPGCLPCRKYAQKQPASLLRRKPASVSIATARDGGYHRAAARPVSLPVPVTQRAGQAVAGVAITSWGEAGEPQPPWGHSCVGGGTWGPVTGQPGSSTKKVQPTGTVLSFQSELHYLGLCRGTRRQHGEGFSPPCCTHRHPALDPECFGSDAKREQQQEGKDNLPGLWALDLCGCHLPSSPRLLVARRSADAACLSLKPCSQRRGFCPLGGR